MTPRNAPHAWETTERQSAAAIPNGMLIGLLDEEFDKVYDGLLQEDLVSLSDELQQRLRAIVIREVLRYFTDEGPETVFCLLEETDTEPLREILRDRIGRHLLQTDVLDTVGYDPQDPVVLVHVGLRTLRDERRR